MTSFITTNVSKSHLRSINKILSIDLSRVLIINVMHSVT